MSTSSKQNLEFKLNVEQWRAVVHDSKKQKLLVIAGPGTGKTTVIIHKLIYLAEEYDIEKVLVTSFTNRAINEILHRSQKNIHLAFNLKYAGTMHSIAIKILNKFKTELLLISKKLFYNAKISVLPSNWALRSHIKKFIAITSIQKIENYISQIKLKSYLALLDQNPKAEAWTLYKAINNNVKNQGRSSFEPQWNHGFEHDIELSGNDPEKHYDNVQIFNIAHEFLLQEGLMDFADSLIWFHQLLIHGNVAGEWAKQYFSHILVDEFQDMNELQLKILQELSGEKHNLSCVGDPNQAIYGFQGAFPKIFEDFIYKNEKNNTSNFLKPTTQSEVIPDIEILQESYPEIFKKFQNSEKNSTVMPVILKQNYRSHGNIIDFSNKMLEINEQKITMVEGGEEKPKKNIYFFEYTSVNFAKQQLINMIKILQKNKTNLKDIAILFPNKTANINVEKILFEEKINFINYQDVKIFDDWKIQVFICFLNLFFSNDSFCIKTLLQLHQQEQKIDEDIFKLMEQESKNYKGDWYEALMNIKIPDNYGESERNINKLKNFIQEEIHNWLKDQQEFLNEVFHLPKKDEGDITKYINGKINITISHAWHLIKKIDTYWNGACYKQKSSHDTLQTIKQILWLFYDRCWNAKNFFLHLLDYVKFYFDDQENDCINISTIHSVKGCEFDHVFVVGVTDGYLPFWGSEKNKKDHQEELRKLYVASTRSRQCLYLFHAGPSETVCCFIRQLLQKNLTYFISMKDQDVKTIDAFNCQ